MGYMKELAERGREFIDALEEDCKTFIRANNKEQVELFEKNQSVETSSKKENDATPE